MAAKPPLVVERFGGMVPILDDWSLPDDAASYCQNAALYGQVLQGFNVPKLLHTMADPGAKYAYRIPTSYSDVEPDSPGTWLEFDDPDTIVFRAPVVDDQYDRYYWHVPGQAMQYNTKERIIAGDPPYTLGIPVPDTAPIVTAPAIVAQHTASAALPPGGTALVINSVVDVEVGDTVLDMTTTTTTATASAASALYASSLTLSSVVGIKVGMYVSGVTQPGSVVQGTYVTQIVGSVVTIYPSIYVAVNIGDTFQFKNYGQIPDGTTVTAIAGTTVTLSAGTVHAGVSSGDLIQFQASIAVTRAYLYTWVSDFGEEGAPSPPTVANGSETGVWHIQVFPPTAGDLAGRNLTKTRIYRTITDSAGSASYFQVVELPIATLTYDDHIPDTTVSGAQILESVEFTAPPVFDGMITMANGMVLGWAKTDIWFCEPYRPHAWPFSYVLSTDYEIVGVGIFAQSAVLCTREAPYVATGTSPSAVTLQKLNVTEPCKSRGSVISGMQGVYYASPSGLAVVNPYGVGLSTKETIGWRIWNKLVHPDHLRAVRYGGVYVSFDTEPGTPQQFGAVIDPTDKKIGFAQIATMAQVDNVLADPWSGCVQLISGGAVYQWDPPDGVTQIPWVWRSKEFHTKYKLNFGVLKVYFDDGIMIKPSPPDGATIGPFDASPGATSLGPTALVHVKIWANTRLVYDQDLLRSGVQISLPSGFKAEVWQFELSGRVNCMAFHMAVNAKDLKAA